MRFTGCKALAAAALVLLALGASWVSLAGAKPPKNDNDPGGDSRPEDPDGDPCSLSDVKARSFRASPDKIDYTDIGKRVTLKWQVRFPSSGCSTRNMRVGVSEAQTSQTRRRGLRRFGSLRVRPKATTNYTLLARRGNSSRALDRLTVHVVLPKRCNRPTHNAPPTGARTRARRRGGPPRCGTVTIGSNDEAPLLRQALGSEKTAIRVKDNVRLNLTGSATNGIPIAGNVTLTGGRTPRAPGPLLYSKSRPKTLFSIQGDNVRISGLRIEGADMGVPGDGSSNGISLDSKRGVEIDNNEIYGWKGSAVGIRDNQGRIDYFAPHEVRVHDNFIHHNQHVGRLGYGVVVSDGSYAEIERNVFDWNRHAIAGDGSNDSGYKAYDNLVLKNGGLHRWIPFPGFWVNTHQFDMHAQNNCGVFDIFSDSLFNCGPAGHDIDVRYNSFSYEDAAAIKLRGTPALKPNGAFVISNVFQHDSVGDAVKQNESGLYLSNNLANVSWQQIQCDIDRNGTRDLFLPTGQTWWWSSGGNRPWTFLQRSQARPTSCP